MYDAYTLHQKRPADVVGNAIHVIQTDALPMALLKRESLPPASPQDSFSALASIGQPSGQRRTGGIL